MNETILNRIVTVNLHKTGWDITSVMQSFSDKLYLAADKTRQYTPFKTLIRQLNFFPR